MDQSQGYGYAEQANFNGVFAHWPNSRYDIGNKVDNSNTYAEYIITHSGLAWHKLSGKHPGLDSPVPIPDIYGGHKPFRTSTINPASPPQPPATLSPGESMFNL